MVRRFIQAALLMALSSTGMAAGNTEWAVPTRIDVMYAGIMVYGAFGNTGGCTAANSFFIPINTGQYKEIYATLMMAYASGKQVAAYVNACDSIGWYASPSVTFNFMNNAGIIYVQN